MAHVTKYTKIQSGHMLRHFERTEEITKERENIDATKTHLNYNLVPSGTRGQERLNERLKKVYCLNRKDVNVLCDWIVTAPQTLPEERQEEFFKESYNFMCGRYGGENNVISACVHNDEQQPHLHFAFIPVTYDKKKEKEKVSAKEVINRKDLQTFHQDLQKHLEHKMNMKIDILNGATVEGNKSICELKRGTAIQKIKQYDKVIQSQHKLVLDAEDRVRQKRIQEVSIDNDIATKQDNLEDLQKQIEEQKNKLSEILNKIDNAHIENKIYFNNNQIEQKKKDTVMNEKKKLFSRKEVVEIEKDKFNELFEDIKKISADNEQCRVLVEHMKKSYLENEDLKDRNKKLEKELQEQKNRNFEKFFEIKNLLDKLEKIYKRHPEVEKEMNKEKNISPGRRI